MDQFSGEITLNGDSAKNGIVRKVYLYILHEQ